MNNTTQNCKDGIFRLDGKVVVITGALGILGREYCKAVAEQGAELVIADKNFESCKAFAVKINKESGAKTHACSVDLSSEDSIKDWSKKILDKSGKVDVLMNNAAAKTDGFFTSLEKYSLKTWNEIMAVNVNAAFLAVRELGPGMASRGSGSIINVSSIYGVVGPDQSIYEGSWYEDLGGAINTPLVYAASKGAVISMTRYLATYWGSQGVRCNCLTPGGVSSGQNDTFDKKYSSHVPLGRMAKSSELIGAMLFLASDASSYVNGQNLIVDGGWTAW